MSGPSYAGKPARTAMTGTGGVSRRPPAAGYSMSRLYMQPGSSASQVSANHVV